MLLNLEENALLTLLPYTIILAFYLIISKALLLHFGYFHLTLKIRKKCDDIKVIFVNAFMPKTFRRME